jgi:hypothetical protein
MRLAIILGALCTAVLPSLALATGNAPISASAVPYTDHVEGLHTYNVVVYTDDCYGYDYILDALAAKGVAYTLFYADPFGFQTAVASGAYNMILVNHECYFECSYAWCDIVNAYLNGARVGVSSFDWDQSHDYSGCADDLLALAQDYFAGDVDTQGTVYNWGSLLAGCGSSWAAPGTGFYFDEGDRWQYTPGVEEAGWTSAPSQPNGNVNRVHGLVVMGFTVDELSQVDGQCIWQAVINELLYGASAAEQATWSSVKSLYQ